MKNHINFERKSYQQKTVKNRIKTGLSGILRGFALSISYILTYWRIFTDCYVRPILCLRGVRSRTRVQIWRKQNSGYTPLDGKGGWGKWKIRNAVPADLRQNRMKCGRAKKGNATGVRRIQDVCPADVFLLGSNAITSLGVQSSISHNRPSVYMVMDLLCFRLYTVLDGISCLKIRV